MTKPIICAAFMSLYEEGRFQLLEPVAKYIPAFGLVRVLSADADGGVREVDLLRPITIRDLLTHTAGLTYDFFEESPVCERYRQARIGNDARRSLEEVVLELARLPLAYQPGTRWHYSWAIDVVAYLIEVLTGHPLEQFLKERLFGPLGMTDTDFYVPPKKRGRLATMYGLPDLLAPGMTASKLEKTWGSGFNERIDVSDTYPAIIPHGFARGGYGLFTTAWDYMRFAQMLLNLGELDGARILSPKTIALMHMNHLPAALLPFDLGQDGYGFGLGSRVLLNVAESAGPGSVGEFGWGGAATTQFWVDPQEELVGILMSQSMMAMDGPIPSFRALAYASLTD